MTLHMAGPITAGHDIALRLDGAFRLGGLAAACRLAVAIGLSSASTETRAEVCDRLFDDFGWSRPSAIDAVYLAAVAIDHEAAWCRMRASIE